MSDRHYAHWPKGLPHHMSIPQTDLFYNVEVSARRFADKPCLVFDDTQIGFAGFRDEAERIAGWLQGLGVQKGDHRHFGGKQRACVFTTPEQLLADFQHDIARWNHENSKP